MPWCNIFMKRLGSRRKIIGRVITLLVKIHMYLRQPFIKKSNMGFGFFLCLPCPIAVQVKIIMVYPSARPWLSVFAGVRIGIGRSAFYRIVKINITVAAIRIDARINNHNCILKPCLRARI